MTFLYYGKKYFRYLKWKYNTDKFCKVYTLSSGEIYTSEIKQSIMTRKKSFLKIVETQSPFSRNIDKVISKRLKYF